MTTMFAINTQINWPCSFFGPITPDPQHTILTLVSAALLFY